MPRTCTCCASSARNCKILVAVGACAVNGGLPAQRNHLDLGICLQEVYLTEPGLANGLHSQRPRTAAAARQGASAARGRESRLLHSRLSAIGRRDLDIPDRPDRRTRRRARARPDPLRLRNSMSFELETAAQPAGCAASRSIRCRGSRATARSRILLDDDDRVHQVRLHIVEFRGFEKFVQGRPLLGSCR